MNKYLINNDNKIKEVLKDFPKLWNFDNRYLATKKDKPIKLTFQLKQYFENGYGFSLIRDTYNKKLDILNKDGYEIALLNKTKDGSLSINYNTKGILNGSGIERVDLNEANDRIKVIKNLKKNQLNDKKYKFDY